MTTETLPRPTSTLPVCSRDGTPTRLTCGRCGAPICPACLVRTAVGMRCAGCAGGPAAPQRRRRVPVTVLVVVAGLMATLWAVGLRSGGGGAQVDDEVASAPAAAPGIGDDVTVGPLAVTVSQFRCAPEDGRPTQRCEASLQVRNDSFGFQEFRPSLQRVADGFRRFLPIEDVTSIGVDPGQVADVTVAFRLPQTQEPSRLELRTAVRQTPARVSVRA